MNRFGDTAGTDRAFLSVERPADGLPPSCPRHIWPGWVCRQGKQRSLKVLSAKLVSVLPPSCPLLRKNGDFLYELYAFFTKTTSIVEITYFCAQSERPVFLPPKTAYQGSLFLPFLHFSPRFLLHLPWRLTVFPENSDISRKTSACRSYIRNICWTPSAEVPQAVLLCR